MNEFEYKDYTPANARVIVNYDKGQDVKFSYPIEWTYWKAVWRRAFPTVIGFWSAIHYVFLFYIAMFTALGIAIYVSFFPVTTFIEAHYSTMNIYSFLPLLLVLFYLIGIPFIATIILAMDKERLSKYVPVLGYLANKLAGGIKKVNFKAKDVNDNKVVIPCFSNVYLEYKCTGDFNKYLSKVEILEIPFIYMRRSRLNPFKMKEERNDHIFRAVFYFSNNIKEGDMSVEFI